MRNLLAKIDELAAFLEREGATVSRTARPLFPAVEAYHLYLRLLDAAWSGRQNEHVIADKRAAAARRAPDDMSADAIMVRGVDMTHRTWLGLNEKRAKYRRAWSAFFQEWDVLLCPPIATAALPHRQDGNTWERTVTINGRTIAYNDMLFWPGLTCGYHLPASVAPIGFHARRPAAGRADRRAALWRSHDDRGGRDAGACVAGVHRARRVGIRRARTCP